MIYEYQKAIFTGETLEVYQYERAPQVATGGKPRGRKADSGRSGVAPEKRHDSIRRARRGFLRLVQANLSAKGAPAFLTLTFASNADLDTGLQCFREFNQRSKKEFGDSISYIAVPEFQKRGAVHFHVLIWGLDDKYILHEVPWFWRSKQKKKIKQRYLDWCKLKGYDPKESRGTRYIQSIWARGYADIVPADDSPKLAGYMAKYMQKAMHDERLLSRRSYYNSRNIVRPLLYKTARVADYPKEILGVDIELLTEKSYGTEWLGRGNYKVFKVMK